MYTIYFLELPKRKSTHTQIRYCVFTQRGKYAQTFLWCQMEHLSWGKKQGHMPQQVTRSCTTNAGRIAYFKALKCSRREFVAGP